MYFILAHLRFLVRKHEAAFGKIYCVMLKENVYQMQFQRLFNIFIYLPNGINNAKGLILDFVSNTCLKLLQLCLSPHYITINVLKGNSPVFHYCSVSKQSRYINTALLLAMNASCIFFLPEIVPCKSGRLHSCGLIIC